MFGVVAEEPATEEEAMMERAFTVHARGAATREAFTREAEGVAHGGPEEDAGELVEAIRGGEHRAAIGR
jgi:hypothetical protein